MRSRTELNAPQGARPKRIQEGRGRVIKHFIEQPANAEALLDVLTKVRNYDTKLDA